MLQVLRIASSNDRRRSLGSMMPCYSSDAMAPDLGTPRSAQATYICDPYPPHTIFADGWYMYYWIF